MNFSQRSCKPELLDGPDIPFVDIKQNMDELAFINKRLGGHHITVEGFRSILAAKKQVSVCEIGCGGGDNLQAIQDWAIRHRISIRVTGIDINKDCIRIAEEKSWVEKACFIRADYAGVLFEDGKPDIIFSSLFCHHFKEAELKAMMQWMDQHSGLGFFINDLHRHFIAYHSIRFLTNVFSDSYLVKNDAPLSVLRGFRKKDWIGIMKAAEIHSFSIKWKWAFRWLIIVKK